MSHTKVSLVKSSQVEIPEEVGGGGVGRVSILSNRITDHAQKRSDTGSNAEQRVSTG